MLSNAGSEPFYNVNNFPYSMYFDKFAGHLPNSFGETDQRWTSMRILHFFGFNSCCICHLHENLQVSRQRKNNNTIEWHIL